MNAAVTPRDCLTYRHWLYTSYTNLRSGNYSSVTYIMQNFCLWFTSNNYPEYYMKFLIKLAHIYSKQLMYRKVQCFHFVNSVVLTSFFSKYQSSELCDYGNGSLTKTFNLLHVQHTLVSSLMFTLSKQDTGATGVHCELYFLFCVSLLWFKTCVVLYFWKWYAPIFVCFTFKHV